MKAEELVQSADAKREAALAKVGSESVEARTEMAAALEKRLKKGASKLVKAEDEGDDTDEIEEALDRVLVGLAHLDVPAAQAALATATGHDSELVRKRVAAALAEVRTPTARVALEALAKDDDDEVLDELGGAVAAAPWPEIAAALLERVRGDGALGADLAAGAAAAATTAGADVQRAVADALLARASAAPKGKADGSPLHALAALIRFGGAFPGVADGAKKLEGHADLRLRAAGLALAASAGVGRDAALARLLELAAKGDADESASANVQLRTIPAAIVAPALVAATKSGDPAIRARAAELSVGTIFLAREATIEPLLALTKDPDEGVRAAAVASLGRALPPGKAFFGDRKGVIAPALDGLASDPSKKVQEALQRARKVLGLG